MQCYGSKKCRLLIYLNELKSSRSVCGMDSSKFRVAGRDDCLCSEQDHPEANSRRRSVARNRKPEKKDRFLRGRQIAFMIYDYFRVTGAHDTVLDYAGWNSTLHDDNSQDFDTRWDDVLLSMSKIPSDDILESLYKLIIRESAQLKTVLELYDMEIHQKISMPNYQKLKTMLKRSADQKLRLRNFDASHGRIERGAVLKNRREWVALKEEKVSVTSGKKKAECSKGDQCSFRHESNDRAHKPDHNAATASEPSSSRGRSVSKRRSVQGKSNHGAILRQPCRYDLKGTCTRSLSSSRVSILQYRNGVQSRVKVFVPASWGWWTTKQKGQRNATIHTKEEKATTRMLWLLWQLYHNWVASRKTRMRWYLK